MITKIRVIREVKGKINIKKVVIERMLREKAKSYVFI